MSFSLHANKSAYLSAFRKLDELNRLMQVRAAVLKNFGEKNIREGAPLATIEDALVPIYMLHRYQVEAATKFVAGAGTYPTVIGGNVN